MQHGIIRAVSPLRALQMALRTGASLVPIYHFGETELYDQVENPVLRKLQMW